MPERASVYQTLILGVESTSTPGVQVTANKRMLDFMAEVRPVIPVPAYRPQGSVAPTTNTAQKENTAGTYSGQIGYNSLIYILASLLKSPSITTPSGGSTARRHTFKPANFTPDTFQTYTFDKGSSVGAERFGFGIFGSGTFRWTRTEANLTGNVMGQVMTEGVTINPSPTDIPALPLDPRSVSVWVGSSYTTEEVQTISTGGTVSGGTFTISYDQQTTAPIAFGATATAVQAALRLLPNIGANNITCAGGPLPATPVTITTAGQLSGLDISLMTANGAALTGAAPTIAIAATTPGGMTKLLRVSSAEIAIPDRYGYGFTLNQSDPSYSFAVQLGLEPTAQLVLEHDSASVALMTSLRSRTTLYCKIMALGPTIETVTSPFLNQVSFFFPFRFIEADRGDVDGVFANTFNMSLIYEPITFQGWLQVDVDNNLAAL